MEGKYNAIIDEEIQAFLSEIKNIVSIDSKCILGLRSDFQVFSPANNDYFEYRKLEGFLEWKIRDHLVINIIIRCLESDNYEIQLPEKKQGLFARIGYSNEKFANDYGFAFIIKEGEQRIAVCIGNMPDEAYEDFAAFQLKHQITKAIVIDFSNKPSKENNRITHGLYKDCTVISIKEFLVMYFSATFAEEYMKVVKNSVVQANNVIGFQTIPNLSLRNLSVYKAKILEELIRFDIKKRRYRMFDDEGNLTERYLSIESDVDLDIIHNYCIEGKYISYLISDEDFAKCFITSEYLYSIYEKCPQDYFDYSTVVAGYFKSVELLLFKIMKSTLNMDNHEKLWIEGYRSDKVEWKPRNNGGTLVKFKKDYEQYFKTEIGPLIHFIKNNNAGWHFEKANYDVISCLLNYGKGCRNEHLHKDLILDLKTVEAVRENTIICLFYLLGGCEIFNTDLNKSNELERYNRIYKRLNELPRSVEYYFLKFKNQDEIAAIRCYDRPVTKYDDFGNIITAIPFITVDNFSDNKVTIPLSENSDLSLSIENMPEKMWWYNKYKGRNEIDLS